MYMRTPSGIVIARLRAYQSKRSRRAEALAWGRSVALLAVIAATATALVLAGLATV